MPRVLSKYKERSQAGIALKIWRVHRSNVQRKRLLADDGLDGHMPAIASVVHGWCCNMLRDEHPCSGEVVGTRTQP